MDVISAAFFSRTKRTMFARLNLSHGMPLAGRSSHRSPRSSDRRIVPSSPHSNPPSSPFPSGTASSQVRIGAASSSCSGLPAVAVAAPQAQPATAQRQFTRSLRVPYRYVIVRFLPRLTASRRRARSRPRARLRLAVSIVRGISVGFLGSRSCHLSRAAGEVGRGSGREGAAEWASAALGGPEQPSPGPESPTSPGGRGD